MDWVEVRDRVIVHALESGWAAAGVAGLEPPLQARDRTIAAIESGRMEGVPWLSAERIDAASDLGRRSPWARAALSLAWPYRPALPPGRDAAEPASAAGRPRGRIAAYACLPGESAATAAY